MNAERESPSLRISARYFHEPPLSFAEGREDIDPKRGIARFGPKSYQSSKRHPAGVRVGFIGSAETIENTRRWMESSSRGLWGDKEHPDFPGYDSDRGFFSHLVFDDTWQAQLNSAEIDGLLKMRPARARFEAAVQLLETKLLLLASKDLSPEYVVLAVPQEMYRKCRVANYLDPRLGEVHRDLRRAFKAMAMKYRIPTQLLLTDTIQEEPDDYPSEIAWDFFTGLYFKAGGYPWGPVGLSAGTCYIGISFYRPLGSELPTVQTSLVQAFDEHGDGLVLRGHDFAWDPNKQNSRSPHLTAEQAAELVKLVLDRYRSEMGQTPRRVVVHKTSRYWPEERVGFREALQAYVAQFDLVALQPQSAVRLLTANKYPPLRGTYFRVGEIDYLYSTGYIAELRQFHSVHVPSPLQIADHVGQDTPRDALLKEILVLTKLNWNSSRLGGLMPITLTFSRLVGDIMREIPPDREPLTNFKFYM